MSLLIPIGITAGLGLLTVAQIRRWKREQAEKFFAEGGVLPEPGKDVVVTHWEPEYGEAYFTPAPHPDIPNSAAYILTQGRTVRSIDTAREPPHWGLDLSAPIGTPIFAAKGGQVMGSGRISGYGYTVQISHGDQSTLYAHMNVAIVRVGQQVSGGDIIGEVGRSTEGEEELTSPWGARMGAHLHFEVHPSSYPLLRPNWRRLDPIRWLRNEQIEMYRERW